MRAKPFRFKQFEVYQDRCGMKITTDACIFGALIRHETTSNSRVLDIGTGTGLLSLLVAQRLDGHIESVEIDPEAAKQAEENFKRSPWSNRLTVHATSIEDFQSAHKFDLILSNPPFFSNQLLSKSFKKQQARHQVHLPIRVLIEKAETLLAPHGTAWFLLPSTASSFFLDTCYEQGLHCHQVIRAKSFSHSISHVSVFQISKSEQPRQTSDLIYYKGPDKAYTEEVSALLAPFYLAL